MQIHNSRPDPRMTPEKGGKVMAFKINDGERIVFIGDSITDCGRRHEGSMPLGNGYVKFFSDLLISSLPENKIEVINKGIGGNTILDLQQRWEDDLISKQPHWVSILIGINDVHRVLRQGESWLEFTPENFKKRYEEIMKRIQDKLSARIILMEPFYISVDNTDHWRGKVLKELQEYCQIVAEISEKYETYLIKLHDMFQWQLQFRESETFCPEPVHPNHTGHLLIAEAIFKLLNDEKDNRFSHACFSGQPC
jgi:lysophospholipase L1-like esterase